MHLDDLVPVDSSVIVPVIETGNFNKEALIEQLQAFYKRYNVVPRTSRLGSAYGLASHYSFCVYVSSSWEEVLRQSGLPTDSDFKQSRREELLKKLVEFKYEHGRAPLTTELNKEFDMPAYQEYRRLFNEPWRDILYRVGMTPARHHLSRYSKAHIAANITKYARAYGAVYDRKKAASMGLPSLESTQVLFNKDWSTILVDLGIIQDKSH